MSSLPPEYVTENRAGRIVGVIGACYFIALTFVSLRVYVRLMEKGQSMPQGGGAGPRVVVDCGFL